ncbi:unnamed protein product, partial [Polarella glacialis]
VEADFRRRERDLAEAFENAKKAAKEKRERAKMIQRAMGLPVDEDEPEDEESEVYKAASVQRVKSDVPQGFGAPAKVLFKKLVLKRNKTDIQAELRVPSEVRVVRWARAVAESSVKRLILEKTKASVAFPRYECRCFPVKWIRCVSFVTLRGARRAEAVIDQQVPLMKTAL